MGTSVPRAPQCFSVAIYTRQHSGWRGEEGLVVVWMEAGLCCVDALVPFFATLLLGVCDSTRERREGEGGKGREEMEERKPREEEEGKKTDSSRGERITSTFKK